MASLDHFVLSAYNAMSAKSTHYAFSDIPDMVIVAMKHVEGFGVLSGADKKSAVIKIVTRLVDESDLCGPMEPLVLAIIPGMIDNLVEVDRGRLRIKRGLVKKLVSMCKC